MSSSCTEEPATITPKRRTQQQSTTESKQPLDEVQLNAYIKKTLDSCVQRNVNSNESALNLINKKSDLSLRILESLISNRVSLDSYDKLVQKIASLLDKVNKKNRQI